MKHLSSLSLALSVLIALPGCEVGSSRPMTGTDGGVVTNMDGGIRTGDGAVPFDPFDPANACGISTIPTEQVPGSLLIVFDKSGSMSDDNKWTRATAAINNVLGATNDELNAGLMLFPTSSSSCGITTTPDVPIAPLSTSRPQIQSTLSSSGPGGGTPAFAALLAGYDHINALTLPGQKAVVLVSDGGEGCDRDMQDQVFARVTMERENNDVLTYAVGLAYGDNILSTIAYNGGTPRNSTCQPMCTSSGECFDDSECPSGNCEPLTGMSPLPGFPTPGFCACTGDADCIGGQTCEDGCDVLCGGDPFCEATVCGFISPPDQCDGPTDCCHYNVAEDDFQAQFEAALDEIARRLLDSCVFAVPRGTDPSMFESGLVNVGVTFDGESRMVLRQSSDASMSSWNYTDSAHETLIIQGPVCERLLDESATVEIVLGCPTILI